MRSFKITAFAVGFSLLGIFLCSVAFPGFNKDAFAVKCYEYSSSIANQSLNPGSPDFIIQSQFENTANWILRTDDPSSVCSDGEYVCRICFDDSQVPGLSVSLGAQEEAVQLGKLLKVLKAVFNWITSNGTPPNATPITVNVDSVIVIVIVYLKPNE